MEARPAKTITMSYKFFRLISKIICLSLFHLQVVGRKNVYKAKGAILAVNHSSFGDPVFAGVACSRPLYYLARKSLFQYRFFGALLHKCNCIQFNRDAPDVGALRYMTKLLREGKLVLMFPEGTRSPDGQLLPGRAGIGLVALRAKVPIIPVYVKGAFKVFPRHRIFPKLGKVRVSIGEPIYLDTWFRKSRIEKTDYEEIAKVVMNRIKRLKNDK